MAASLLPGQSQNQRPLVAGCTVKIWGLIITQASGGSLSQVVPLSVFTLMTSFRLIDEWSVFFQENKEQNTETEVGDLHRELKKHTGKLKQGSVKKPPWCFKTHNDTGEHMGWGSWLGRSWLDPGVGKQHRWITSGEISREVKKGTGGAFYENGHLEHDLHVLTATVGKGNKNLPSELTMRHNLLQPIHLFEPLFGVPLKQMLVYWGCRGKTGSTWGKATKGLLFKTFPSERINFPKR